METATPEETVFETLEENTLRVESIIWIGGMQNAGSLASALSDLFDTMEWDEVSALFPKVPKEIDDDYSSERLCEWLSYTGHTGYLVRYGTPVMKHRPNLGSSYSWGYYNTKWIYGESVEQTLAEAVAWAEQRREAEKSESNTPS